MGGKSSSPSTPDYTSAAKATAAGNLDAARYATYANRPTQVTPYGTSTWTVDQGAPTSSGTSWGGSSSVGGTSGAGSGNYYSGSQISNIQKTQGTDAALAALYGGGGGSSAYPSSSYGGSSSSSFTPEHWTQTITLSPQTKALFDKQQNLSNQYADMATGMLGQVKNSYAQPFDTSGLQNVDMQNADPGALDQSFIDQHRNQLIAQQQPYLDSQRQQTEVQLRNQGIQPGSEAWNNAMQSVNQTQADALTNASLNAEKYAQGIYNTNLARANYLLNQSGQQAKYRQQQIAEKAYLRELPLTELNALRSGSQPSMPSFPSFAQQQTTAGPDYSGAMQNTYNANLAASNAKNASSSNMWGGIANIAGLVASPFTGGASLLASGLLSSAMK